MIDAIIKLCRERIATEPTPSWDDGEFERGEIGFARKILDALGEQHGDEERQAAKREEERLERERDQRSYAIFQAHEKVRLEALALLRERRREVFSWALERVWPQYHNLRGTSDVVAQLEDEMRLAVSEAVMMFRYGDLGVNKMKVSIDGAGNVGVSWED